MPEKNGGSQTTTRKRLKRTNGALPVWLLVEDNPGDVRLMREAIEACGLSCDLRHAGGAAETMDMLDAGGAGSAPVDLIVLDLNLPGVGGLDLLRQIKSVPRLRRVPVVVLSSSSREEDAADSVALGAVRYLVKPLGFDGLVEVVEQLRPFLRGAPPPPDTP